MTADELVPICDKQMSKIAKQKNNIEHFYTRYGLNYSPSGRNFKMRKKEDILCIIFWLMAKIIVLISSKMYLQ